MIQCTISQLADFLKITVEGINATLSVFLSALRVSYVLGHSIVTACVNFAQNVYTALQLFFSAVYVVYKDYCFFIDDLVTKCKWVFNEIYLAYNNVCFAFHYVQTTLNNLSDSLLYVFDSNCNFLRNAIYKGGTSVFFGLEIIKQSLIFIGNSTWYFIRFIPFIIVYSVTLFVYYLNEAALEVYYFIRNVCLTIFSILEKFVMFFSDIPCEAAFGLVVLFLTFCFLMKYSNVISWCSGILFSRILRSWQVVIAIWRMLKRLVYWVFRALPGIKRSRSSYVRETSPLEPHRSSCNSRCCEHISELANKLCVVCQDKEKTVIVLPCRHVCLCLVCCTIIEEQYGRCPVCRQLVERTMTVYI